MSNVPGQQTLALLRDMLRQEGASLIEMDCHYNVNKYWQIMTKRSLETESRHTKKLELVLEAISVYFEFWFFRVAVKFWRRFGLYNIVKTHQRFPRYTHLHHCTRNQCLYFDPRYSAVYIGSFINLLCRLFCHCPQRNRPWKPVRRTMTIQLSQFSSFQLPKDRNDQKCQAIIRSSSKGVHRNRYSYFWELCSLCYLWPSKDSHLAQCAQKHQISPQEAVFKLA